jgi:hypothetical protein
MTTITETIAGLEAALDTIPGLSVFDHVPGANASFPIAMIVPPIYPDYRDDLGDGSVTCVFEIAVLVASAIAENQRTLIPLMDPRSSTSIFQAIETDRSLGGLDVDALCTGAPRRLTFDEMAAYKAWGQIVTVQVMVS